MRRTRPDAGRASRRAKCPAKLARCSQRAKAPKLCRRRGTIRLSRNHPSFFIRQCLHCFRNHFRTAAFALAQIDGPLGKFAASPLPRTPPLKGLSRSQSMKPRRERRGAGPPRTRRVPIGPGSESALPRVGQQTTSLYSHLLVSCEPTAGIFAGTNYLGWADASSNQHECSRWARIPRSLAHATKAALPAREDQAILSELLGIELS
jgi:hypothetical protein